MIAFEAWRPRRDGRARRRPVAALVESLEGRQLLAYSPLGVAQPDLTVQGYGAPVAAWGGSYAVNVTVSNLGATSEVDPFALTTGLLVPPTIPSSTSAATRVDVYFMIPRRPNLKVLIGSINVPAIPGNTVTELSQTFARIPSRPAGFPNIGGEVQLAFEIDAQSASSDLDRTNNSTFRRPGQAVKIVAAFPDLSVVGLDLPPVMQPGDVVQPNIQVANNGAATAGVGTPIDVALIASTDPNFRRDVRVLDTYTIRSLPGLSEVPMQTTVLGDGGIDRPINISELNGDPVLLPNFATEYYVTAVVDPLNRAEETRDQGRQARRLGINPHSLGTSLPIRKVGPPIADLPPAGVVRPPSSATSNPFPFPSFPVISTQVAVPPGQAGSASTGTDVL